MVRLPAHLETVQLCLLWQKGEGIFQKQVVKSKPGHKFQKEKPAKLSASVNRIVTHSGMSDMQTVLFSLGSSAKVCEGLPCTRLIPPLWACLLGAKDEQDLQ